MHLTLCSELDSEFLPTIFHFFLPSFPSFYYFHSRDKNSFLVSPPPQMNYFKIYLIDCQLHRFCSQLPSQDGSAPPGNVNLEAPRGQGKEKEMLLASWSPDEIPWVIHYCYYQQQSARTPVRPHSHSLLFRASLAVQLWTTFLCEKCVGAINLGELGGSECQQFCSACASHYLLMGRPVTIESNLTRKSMDGDLTPNVPRLHKLLLFLITTISKAEQLTLCSASPRW